MRLGLTGTAWMLCGMLACRKRPTPAGQDGALASPPDTTPSASISASAAPDLRSPIRAQIDRWNDAHNARDASAFAAVYAGRVAFYGQTLSNAECVKRKMSALAKSPGYSQAVHHLSDSSPDDSGTSRVLFTKTTVEHGASHDYLEMMSFDRTLHIIEENDRTTEAALAKAQRSGSQWCMAELWTANDRIRPPFKISANTALREVTASKHLAELRAEPGLEAIGPLQFDCPEACLTTEPRNCGYDIRIENAAVTEGSQMVEWVYVDAVTNILWFRDLRGDAGFDSWLSEPLHP